MGGLIERFSRPGLTGIRALAASWVMLFHLSAIYGPAWMGVGYGDFMVDVTPLVTIGWVGVNLFFVLSGFLLTTHLLEEYGRNERGRVLRRYAKARFLRVFPAYWAQIAILLAIAWLAHGAYPDWLRFLPAHLIMLHNVRADTSWAINPVYWTLPIELNFYIALPLLMKYVVAKGMEPRVMLRRMVAMLAVVTAVAILYRIAVVAIFRDSIGEIVWAILQLPGTLDEFALGMLAAILFRWARADPRWGETSSIERVSTLLFLVGMSGAIGMMYWVHHTPDYWTGSRLVYFWYTATSAFLAMVILSIAFSNRLTRALFENWLVVWLGTISYSIYLWHYPVSHFVGSQIDRAAVNRFEFAALAFAATVAVSAVSYYLVERPFMRWGAARRRAS